MATRKYEQSLRAEAAEQTRRRILDAVDAHLRAAPAEPVNLDAIARTARVARPTIYAVFGSRAGLFTALAHDLFSRGGFDRVRGSILHPDPAQGLRDGFTAVAELYAGHRDVLRSLFSMAALDAEAVGGAVATLEEDRAGGMVELVRLLHTAGLLRPDVTPEAAVDTLWVLTSFDSFDLLHTGRGLTAPEVARRLIETAERSLYDAARAGSVARRTRGGGQ